MDSSSMITSTSNDSVKYVRSLYRRRTRHGERVFVAEGLRTVEEALKAGVQPAFVFHTTALLDVPRARAVLTQVEEQHANVRAVSEAVMTAMAETVTPSGILAVLPMPTPMIPHPLEWVLILDGLRDPGNLGTILRSALAAGVQLVVTTTGSVDAYSPKVVRSGMGAHFRLHLLLDQPWSAIAELTADMRVLLAEAAEGQLYWQVDWRLPTALVIGGEAEGVSSDAGHLATGHVKIPMRTEVESLNAAVASSVLLFEAARQRFYAPSA